MTATSTLYWFDYETFGISPVWDRPAQFAGIRTDLELRPVAEAEVLWCRPADDYLPHPEACRVTGLAPDEVARRGLPEHRFIARVRDALGAPGTCSVGYNNVRFDDEFTRWTLFRNLFEPYEHEWKDGASRWDLLGVARLARALRPDGIVWPVDEEGRARLRLEDLARANGIAHEDAHDALADVRATIALARLLRERQPRLFGYAFAHRDKASVGALLDPARGEPAVLVAPSVPAARAHLAVVVPLARHPRRPNAVIAFDLATDPEPLAALDAATIAERLFERRPEDPEHVGLHLVATNRCPTVVPEAALRPADAERLGIDLAAQRRHRLALDAVLDEALIGRLAAAFERPFETCEDVDASLYSGGFPSQADRERLARARASEPAALAGLGGFEDRRFDELLFRYRARLYPHTLDAGERARWRAHRRRRLGAGADAPWLGREGFERAMRAADWRAEEMGLRESLSRYAERLCAGLDDGVEEAPSRSASA